MTQTLKFVPKQAVTLARAAETHQGPFEMRLVKDDTGRREIFELRRRAYQEFLTTADAVTGSEFSDAFDDLATTVLLGAYDGGRLVGAQRLCFSRPGDSIDHLPCASHYPELLAVKRKASGSLMEVSRFSIEPGIANTSYRTTLYGSLVRASLLAAEAAGVSTILVATRPESVRFYTYMLGFEMIGQPALYPPGDMKIALLGGSMSKARARQRMQNKFFRITGEEIACMRHALSPVLKQIVAA